MSRARRQGRTMREYLEPRSHPTVHLHNTTVLLPQQTVLLEALKRKARITINHKSTKAGHETHFASKGTTELGPVRPRTGRGGTTLGLHSPLTSWKVL